MIKIKKILCFFLIGILILSLSACGKDKTSSAVQNDTEGATDTNGVTEDAEGNDKEEGAVGNGVTGDAVENVTEEDTAENDTEDTRPDRKGCLSGAGRTAPQGRTGGPIKYWSSYMHTKFFSSHT